MNQNTEHTKQGPSDEQLAASLRALPQLEPSAALYERLNAVSKKAGNTSRNTSRWPLGLIAASLMIAGLFVWVPDETATREGNGLVVESPTDGASAAGSDARLTTTQDDAPSIDLLMARSAYLESLLASMPGEGRVQRVGTASTISALEDRVALIDEQLSQPMVQADAEGSTSLWRQRVGLMNTLVSLRATPSNQIWL